MGDCIETWHFCYVLQRVNAGDLGLRHFKQRQQTFFRSLFRSIEAKLAWPVEILNGAHLVADVASDGVEIGEGMECNVSLRFDVALQ